MVLDFVLYDKVKPYEGYAMNRRHFLPSIFGAALLGVDREPAESVVLPSRDLARLRLCADFVNGCFESPPMTIWARKIAAVRANEELHRKAHGHHMALSHLRASGYSDADISALMATL
jgi:hypothetical protein